jgi:hypothetical protein
MLLWPALLNGYPLVFADTGTYLSQAINRYVGWDRPPFYSLFMLPLHLTLTTWPVVMAQALLAAHLLHLVRRALLPDHSAWWLLALLAGLSALSCLPWLTSELMPDLFTPLLVLALCLLVQDRVSRIERAWLIGLSAFMIAAQQSSLPLALVLMVVSRRRWRRIVLPVVLAVAALVSMNLAATGRVSLSPYGNVFLLARVIYDGPGMAVLRDDCPAAGWRLCGVLDRFPATSDEFLWAADSPVVLVGGHKAVSAEANAIIAAALRAHPWQQAGAFLANGWTQLTEFASGDGLQPWPDTVTPWIARDFPSFEHTAYEAARQTRGAPLLPAWLQWTHAAVGIAGVALCLMLLPGALRRRDPAAAFLAAVLIALPAGAAITGGLSAPHDRYQSRLMWLPPCIGVLALSRRGVTA